MLSCVQGKYVISAAAGCIKPKRHGFGIALRKATPTRSDSASVVRLRNSAQKGCSNKVRQRFSVVIHLTEVGLSILHGEREAVPSSHVARLVEINGGTSRCTKPCCIQDASLCTRTLKGNAQPCGASSLELENNNPAGTVYFERFPYAPPAAVVHKISERAAARNAPTDPTQIFMRNKFRRWIWFAKWSSSQEDRVLEASQVRDEIKA